LEHIFSPCDLENKAKVTTTWYRLDICEGHILIKFEDYLPSEFEAIMHSFSPCDLENEAKVTNT